MCRAPQTDDNGLRALVVRGLLPRLRRLDPRICEADLLFFGTRCDISVPLGAKYGIDTDAESVYNVVNGTDGPISFRDAFAEGGFIGLNVSDGTLEYLTGEAKRRFAAPRPDTVETSDGAELAAAQLLTAAGRNCDIAAVPADGRLRRALWMCLIADSPASFAKAAAAASEAAFLHRRGVALGKTEMQLSPRAAGAMAAALGRFIKNNRQEN